MCCMYTVYSGSWNAGMGNTDTLHPNSCFCSFSIPGPTSEIFENKIFVTSYISSCIVIFFLLALVPLMAKEVKPAMHETQS